MSGLDQDAIRADPVGAFQAVIAADREVLQQLRREVEELGDLVRRGQEDGRSLQNQAHTKQIDAQKLANEDQRLQEALQTAKTRLMTLREEVRRELQLAKQGAEARLQVAVGDHENVNFEHLHLHGDLQHVDEELTFLQRKLEEDKQTCDHFAQANRSLHVHNEELDHQLEHLKQERKHLAEEVIREKGLVKREERQLAELKNKVAQLRRSKLAAHHESRQAESREQVLREMKGGSPQTAAVPAGVQLRHVAQRQVPSTGHSWAHHVFVPTGQLGGSPTTESTKRGVPLGLQSPGAGVHY